MYITRVRYHPCTSRIERCHWWTPGGAGAANNNNATNSLKFTTFDVGREAFTVLGLPMSKGAHLRCCMHENSFHMGRDGSSLIVVLYGMEEERGCSFFKVWAALDYVALGRGDCSWIWLYNVRLDDPPPSCLVVVGFWKHGKWFANRDKGFGVVDTERRELNISGIDDHVEIKGDGSGLDYD
ncbi:unnamed protein product [Linum trigynum]|uniref:S-protein homolog n=1 Tax=Linum trigynum TaxID=586398 RepID=A0AAV2GC69_9ROSI